MMKRLCFALLLIGLFTSITVFASDNARFQQEKKEKGEAEENDVRVNISPEAQAQLGDNPENLSKCQKIINSLKAQSNYLAKAFSYRFFAIGGQGFVAYMVTKSAIITVQIVSINALVATFLYFTYDNLWNKVIVEKGYKKIFCCKKRDDGDNNQDPANNV